MENDESRPKRAGALSAKLRDQDNAAMPELRSHQPASGVSNNSARPTQPPDNLLSRPSPSDPLPNRKCKNGASHLQESSSDEGETLLVKDSRPPVVKGKAACKRARQNGPTECGPSGAQTTVAPTSTLLQDVVDGDGILKDIDVLSIDEAPARENRTRDLDEFFALVYLENDKKMRKCKKCSMCTQGVALVSDVTTLQRHLEQYHRADYLRWAEANGFTSMLPKDCKERKDRALSTQKQCQLDPHLHPVAAKEIIPPYSDELFRDTAIQWLINTDQPLSVLEEPLFHKMIEIASRATKGVKIPNR
ncbi:hypothetical protein J3R83DRAFT_6008 [Lanmaoa asiatica]|nr:hypothetical protein J3R83DRAFT_6008 [Lanmaoa asiatica]